jgi:Flp pilus assembly pilin Flp
MGRSEVHVLREFLREEAGISAIEYGLIGVLITVACLAAMTRTGDAVSGNIWRIIGAISDLI